MELIKDNWQVILAVLIAVIEVIVRLTPSQKDNSILNKVLKVVDFLLPNLANDRKKFKIGSNKK